MTNSVESRIIEIENKVSNLVEVCAAVADDTLRMCFVLDELKRAGQLAPLPWEVATLLVELHHAIEAQKRGATPEGGEDLSKRVEAIKSEVKKLREEYLFSLRIENPEHET